MFDDNSRVYLHGGPGTGKTVLAVEQTQRMLKAGKRIGVVCYNRGLSFEIRRRLDRVRATPSFVGIVKEDLAAFLGVRLPNPPADPTPAHKYWTERVPKLIRRAARRLPRDQRFDAWIVDEAQDLSKYELETLRRMLRDRKGGQILLFGDPKQDVFHVSSDVPWPVAKARLMFNVRCSASIATLLNAVMPETATLVAGDSTRRRPAYLLVDNIDQVEEGVAQAVETLRQSGWEHRHIAVVATGARLTAHDQQRASLRNDSDYWNSYFSDQDIFYTRTMAYKGLERPAVVLAFNSDFRDAAQLREALFVGGGRARDELVLVVTRAQFEWLEDLSGLMIDFRAAVD